MRYYTDIAYEYDLNGINSLMHDIQYGCREITIKIDSNKKQKYFGMDKGEYFLIDCPSLQLLAPIVEEYIAERLANKISCWLDKTKGDENGRKTILVVCLGNENIVSDSLGNACYNKLIISEQDFISRNKMYAISTGVFAQTGVKTSSLVKNIVDFIKPNAVIVIDSFCAIEVNRLGSSFQISNSGITPGGAVNASEDKINSKLLKVPVLSIGVPLVIKTETIINEVLTSFCEIDEDVSNSIIKKCDSIIVTPKDIDFLIKSCSRIISHSINSAVLGLTINEQIKILM